MISGLGAVSNETALAVANDVWEAIKNETQYVFSICCSSPVAEEIPANIFAPPPEFDG